MFFESYSKAFEMSGTGTKAENVISFFENLFYFEMLIISILLIFPFVSRFWIHKNIKSIVILRDISLLFVTQVQIIKTK